MRTILVVVAALVLTGCADNESEDSQKRIRLVRDDYGVPHIYADDIYGLYYGYGYAVAQDRLFQMEMARRSTQGMVAEVLGTDYVEFDKNARRIFSPASIRGQLAALEPADKSVFDGFAAGLNAWLAEIRKNPGELTPKQFLDFGFEPVDWSAYDVVMIFVGTMANRYGDFNTELDNVQIYQSLVEQHGESSAKRLFDLLNPRYTDNAPTTIPADDWSSPVPDVLARGSINRKIAALRRDDAFSGPVISGMSNCYVLGRDKASGANAILVNGPQFGWFTPAYVYSVGMHGAGIDVVGNTPFAYPMIMFGHNASIAWGSTWAAGDIVDIFAEQLDPENPGRYRYKDSYRELEGRIEKIRVRDADAIELEVFRSVHGPIIYMDRAAGIAYAKRRAWDGRELETLLAWLHATWAGDFGEWKAQAEKSAINVNMYFADVDGNIGYFFGGQYPERARGHDNRFPVTGDGSMDWRGRLPIELANPHILNPSTGFIANWNNKPGQGVMNPDEFWYSWSEADRVDYLNNVLAAQDRFTPEEAWAVLTPSSYADLHAPYLLPLIDEAASGRDDDLNSANEILRTWDRQSRDADSDGVYDGAAPAIFRVFVATLVEAVLADDLGAVFGQFAATGYPAPGAPTGAGTNLQPGLKAIVESLGGRGDYDLLNGESSEAVVAAALLATLTRLEAEQGSDMSAWRIPVAERPFLTSNFLGIPQTAAEELTVAPIEQNRGTENNMIVMKKGGIVGYEVTPPGQNAFIGPDGEKGEHFGDQFELYYQFGKKRMWFYGEDVEANKTSETVLNY